MTSRSQSLLLAVVLLALSFQTSLAQNAAVLCSYDGRCLGNFTTSCTCTATGDAAVRCLCWLNASRSASMPAVEALPSNERRNQGLQNRSGVAVGRRVALDGA